LFNLRNDFIEICGEIDINIEESTGLIYEDDLEQA